MSSFEEPTLFEQLADTFRGRMRCINLLVWIEGLIFFVLAVLCVWRFFQVETTRLQIVYAVSFLFFVQLLVLVKIWYWSVVHRNLLLRRIEHLERTLDKR